MSTRTIPFILALAVSLLPRVAEANNDPSHLAESLGSRIESDTEPESGSSIQWGRATAVVGAPTDTVLEVVRDYASYRNFLPHFQKSRILSQRGSQALVYLEADVMHGAMTLWAQMRIAAHKEGNTHVAEGRMLKGNMDRFHARWELTPVEGGKRTLVRMRIFVDPGLPLPSSVFTNENKKSAKRSIRSLREQVRQRFPKLAQGL